MKLLLLTDGMYPYVMGGMQKHSYYLAKYLAKEGVETHVAHCFHKGTIDIVNKGADPEHYSEEELKNLSFSVFPFPKSLKLPGHYIRENWEYSNTIWNALKNEVESYDVIYAQGYAGWRFIKERSTGKLNVPVLINFHGIEMFQEAPNWKVKLQHYLLQKPALWNMQNADYVLSFGARITEVLDKIKISNEKTLEMPIGIEKSWLNNSIVNQEKRTFVFVGRYERRKGVEELNQTLQSLLASGRKDFQMQFIGPIEKEHQIKADKIHYHGPIYDQEKIQEILKNSDVLMCPSHSEGMPTVIMEGMASGLAILATNVGAVSKQVDANNGWLLLKSDPDLIEKAMIEAIEISDEKLLDLKNYSRKKLEEHFLWDRVVKELLGLIESRVLFPADQHR